MSESVAEPAGRFTSQPWLHRLEVAVHGPATCLSHLSGDIDASTAPGAATGLFVDDRRVLDHLVLTLDGVRPVAVIASSHGPSTECLLLARNVGGLGPDPTVEVRRHRTLGPSGMVEDVVVTSRAATEVSCVVEVTAHGDGAELHHVKTGLPNGPPLAVSCDGDRAGWSDERHVTTVVAHGGRTRVDGGALLARWPVVVPPGTSVTLRLEVSTRRASPSRFDAGAGVGRVGWDAVRVGSQDSRLSATVHRSLLDLEHLLLTDPLDADDVFAAAGSPWYLTLFGRDSIWAARMALPFGTDLARGTLRALARRQGTRDDVASAQEPGKILHEVRRTTFEDPTHHLVLPPTYYGTVDATPLWVCLLHDAWRHGLPAADVVGLRAALDAALAWMHRAAASTDDGLLRYHDASGTGLSNQGWKDSGDAMRGADGSVATGPIALVETQAYAVEAALGAADLLEAVFGEDAAGWRQWAAGLADRVRDRFWVDGAQGRVLAMALDRTGRPVDGVGSNMGHALGTGLLSTAESARVARTLASPDVLGPLGIRTLSAANPAYNPLGYHTGSVWTHDSAICAHGLARAGHPEVATRVVSSLVDVAAASGYRWPELFGGEPVGGAPAPYPASCRPQAWAAASAGMLLSTVLGLRPDVPAGRLELAPLPDSPFGAVRVEGLRLAGQPLTVEVDAAGEVVAVEAPPGIDVVVTGPAPPR